MLLNSLLNALPIFYLSFYKMPVSVAKKIVRIQREFLWGGTDGGRKINWVSWKVVCRPKDHGGLCVRDVSLSNLSLLAKWRWRLLQGDNALWREVLEERYGCKVGEKLVGGVRGWPNNASRWWKDLLSLHKGEEVVRRIGNGASTSFWKVAWRGEVSFMVKFHRLFTISTDQEATVQDMWSPNLGGGRWNFNWRRELFVWENNLLRDLMEDLEGFVVGVEDDRWRWKLEDDDIFTVKSLYVKLEGKEVGEVGHPEEKRRVFRQIWKSGAPSKVIAFVWKALLDRIPTRLNLVIRNCLPPNIGNYCVWCASSPESTAHIFLHCVLARSVWLNVMT